MPPQTAAALRALEQYLRTVSDFNLFTSPLPTAAAAVPAGGDAMPCLGCDSLQCKDCFARHAEEMSGPAVFYVDPSAIQAARNGGGVEATVYSEPESASSVPLYTAPAPRGGVTEAMVCELDSLQTLGRAMDAQPALNAQDAEPMAMHLREAFQEWRAGAIDSLRLNDAWDVIWNRARALAAKEAK